MHAYVLANLGYLTFSVHGALMTHTSGLDESMTCPNFAGATMALASRINGVRVMAAHHQPVTAPPKCHMLPADSLRVRKLKQDLVAIVHALPHIAFGFDFHK